jgi:SAM-dependent methyltransferase
MEPANHTLDARPGESVCSADTPGASQRCKQASKIAPRMLDRVEELLRGRQSITVLEAGCGARSYFRFSGSVELHGIDISQEELDKNRDVQHKMLGDIQTYPLPASRYDVVVCWDVIEHLSRPQDALRNMFRSVKPRGLILLGFPNLMSFKGLVTKATPMGFHRLVYRFLGMRSRPFKTYLRRDIIPQRVIQLAVSCGFVTEFFDLEEGAVQKRICKHLWPVVALFYLTNVCIQLLSLGRAPSLWLDYCTVIFRKAEAEAL